MITPFLKLAALLQRIDCTQHWEFVNHNNPINESDYTDDWEVRVNATRQVICSEPQCSFDRIYTECLGEYIAAASPAVIQQLLACLNQASTALNAVNNAATLEEAKAATESALDLLP